MQHKTLNNVKLGLFVMAALLFLVVLLYLIGKNRNLFGNTYELKARFENVQGLVPGNNVRYAGIQAGTVKAIRILNDTTIEVTMVIEQKMQTVIRRNALLSISTEGLVGNKVINIMPAKETAALAAEGDVLSSKKAIDTDEMLQTLSQTNRDVAIIAAGLKETVTRINNSRALWLLLDDTSIPAEVRKSLAHIRQATQKVSSMADHLNIVAEDLKNGRGMAGALLRDTALAASLNDAMQKIHSAGVQADSVTRRVNQTMALLQTDVQEGKGVVHALLRDTALVKKIAVSLDHIEKGTDGFNQNMEALKHNFFFRGYFRKLEKEKAAGLKKKMAGTQ